MSITPADYKLTLQQGADFELIIRLPLQADGVTQTSTSGYAAKLEIKEQNLVTTDLLTFSTVAAEASAGTSVALGGTAGTIIFAYPKENLQLITWSAGRYSLFLTNPSGKTALYLVGAVEVVNWRNP